MKDKLQEYKDWLDKEIKETNNYLAWDRHDADVNTGSNLSYESALDKLNDLFPEDLK